MMLYRIAQELHKSVAEVMLLSATEVRGWAAFLQIQNEEQKKAAKKRN
jgi:hypothetical protein